MINSSVLLLTVFIFSNAHAISCRDVLSLQHHKVPEFAEFSMTTLTEKLEIMPGIPRIDENNIEVVQDPLSGRLIRLRIRLEDKLTHTIEVLSKKTVEIFLFAMVV